MSATFKAEIDEIGNGLSDDVDVVIITSPSNSQSIEIRLVQKKRRTVKPYTERNESNSILGPNAFAFRQLF